MNMIHEAFFTIFALLVACLDIAVLVYAWQTKNLSVGSVVALITLIDNAYTPIAIFNVIYVQYKLNRAAFSRYEEFLNMQDDKQLAEWHRYANRGKSIFTLWWRTATSCLVAYLVSGI